MNTECRYGVATISSLQKITGLFCIKDLSKRLNSAKETYNFKELTHLSHPIISVIVIVYSFLDVYCSTVQGLLDWFEVHLGFTKLLFIQFTLQSLCTVNRS